MANDRTSYIIAQARARGLDPQAVLAVARVEGLSGGIGDGGHAFGPWQLNNAGGVINGHFKGQSADQINKWAWSNTGINYALDRISNVAKGLSGQSAINNIVRRFERPAAPDAEVSKAIAGYGKGGGATPPSLGQTSTPGARPGQPTSPVMGGGAMPGMGGKQQLLLSLLGNQDGGQPSLLTNLLSQHLAAQNAPPEAPAFQTSVGGKVPIPRGTAQAGSPQSGTAPAYDGNWIKRGANVIGEPYKGTHNVGNWQSDNAIDIAVGSGTPIYAPVSGKLGHTGLLNGQGASGGGRFSGERINLFGGGNGFYFAHLSGLAPGISEGATVKKGQLLGYSGSANGVNHLHFGVEHGNPNSYYG